MPKTGTEARLERQLEWCRQHNERHRYQRNTARQERDTAQAQVNTLLGALTRSVDTLDKFSEFCQDGRDRQVILSVVADMRRTIEEATSNE